jgi:hypothetical protein
MRSMIGCAMFVLLAVAASAQTGRAPRTHIGEPAATTDSQQEIVLRPAGATCGPAAVGFAALGVAALVPFRLRRSR